MYSARIAAIVLGCSSTIGTTETVAAQAESKTAVKIRVMDATGAVVPGAAIHAANVNTGAVQSISTDPTGSASLSLPSGTYTASISARGFKMFVGHFIAPVETGTWFDVKLEIAQENCGPCMSIETPFMPEEHFALATSIPLIQPETLNSLPARRLRHRHPQSL